MRASARLVAEAAPGGGCRLTELREAAPIGLRPTADGVYLVSTAQGLVADDDLELDVVVGARAQLRVRGVAASIAYASEAARLSVHARVGRGGSLDWRPGVLIATQRCRTAVSATITLEAGAELIWTEECQLGRFGEGPGELDLSISVELAGAPLLRHRLLVGATAPGWDGPAILGASRAVGYRVVVRDAPLPSERAGEGWAILELAGPAVVLSAVGDDLEQMRRRLDEEASISL